MTAGTYLVGMANEKLAGVVCRESTRDPCRGHVNLLAVPGQFR